jgi:hypothetical protein
MFFERNCPFFRPGHPANEVETAAYQRAFQYGDSVNTEFLTPTTDRASRRIFSLGGFFLCMILTAVYNDAYGEYGF